MNKDININFMSQKFDIYYKAAKENESALSKSVKKMANSAMTSIGRQLGNAIIRGILGTKK